MNSTPPNPIPHGWPAFVRGAEAFLRRHRLPLIAFNALPT